MLPGFQAAGMSRRLEGHDLRPVKAYLSQKALFFRAPVKAHLALYPSRKGTPIALEKHTLRPGKAHLQPYKPLVFLRFSSHKILKIC
jgi:hypothetical protein